MILIGGIVGGVLVLATIILILVMAFGGGKGQNVVADNQAAAPGAPAANPANPAAPQDEGGDFTMKGTQARAASMSNLRQIGLAAHNFHDTYSHFPPEVNQNNPAMGMSWMTGMLPMLDQGAVYQMYSKNDAWNAPANKQVTSLAIATFLHKPGVDDHDASGFGTSNYAGNVHVFGTGKPIGFRDFTDGTSNTFIAGSVAAGYKAWADPGNVRDLTSGIGTSPLGFGLPYQERAHLLMADGSVREVASTVSPQVLEALSKPNDGKASTEGF